jgi:hypothetical protein
VRALRPVKTRTAFISLSQLGEAWGEGFTAHHPSPRIGRTMRRANFFQSASRTR